MNPVVPKSLTRSDWTFGRIHFTNGEFEPAHDQFRRVIELKPLFFSAYSDLAMSCEELGRPDEARATRDQILGLLPGYLLQNPDDSRARMFYAVSLAETGRKDDALREGKKALEISPDDARMLYNCACLYSRLAEPQRGMEMLRQAVAKGFSDFGWMRHDPDSPHCATTPSSSH